MLWNIIIATGRGKPDYGDSEGYHTAYYSLVIKSIVYKGQSRYKELENDCKML